MVTSSISFENICFNVVHYVLMLIENSNFQYLMIWFWLIVTIATITILSKISVPYDRRMNHITKVLKKKKIMNEDEMKLISIPSAEIKSKVMIDHITSLRKLHSAAERCYIKKNALKCIQIVSYCPHMVNVKNKLSGMTPFHKVCYHGHTSLVSYMLSKGANPWLTTDAGETALCLAIRACIKNPNESISCIIELQKYGCYLEHTNKWYKIYLEAALLTNNKLLVRWIFEQASSLGTRCSSCSL